MVEQVTPVGAALTQLQTALADVITALSDAAGHAVITQGTAAWEIDAYVAGLHWHAKSEAPHPRLDAAAARHDCCNRALVTRRNRR
jgi:hypothetical protein